MSRGRPVTRLSDQEARAFLESKPGWAILTTVGRDGFPHTVPLGYFLHGDDIVLGTLVGTQKTLNVERNPHVSVLVERTAGKVLTGVMIQGIAEVVADDAGRLELQQEAARQRGDVPPTAPRPGGVYLKVRPRRIISWRYD